MKTADDFELYPGLLDDLEHVRRKLHADGELPPHEKLEQYYRTFRERFGPDALLGHDGEALLSLMHESKRDGMIYWLEFKGDDEFPPIFGSIAGGSALKYGFYRRQETGEWTTGWAKQQRRITIAEAVDLARCNRDQLVAASELLAQLPPRASSEAYAHLQRELERVAPAVQDSSWGHKYLALVHPDKLANFHAVSHQRFHLAKLLQNPLRQEGRYVNESHFVSLSRALNCPLNHVMSVLIGRNGVPHRYWKVGTRSGDTKTSHWDHMRRESVVAVGWAKLGDLSETLERDNFREILKARLAELYPAEPRVTGRSARKLTNFCKRMADGDIVLASDGATVLGVGRVNGQYQHSPDQEFPHQRPVKWLDLDEWHLPTTEGLRTTIHEYRKHFDNWVAIERRILEPNPHPPNGPGRWREART